MHQVLENLEEKKLKTEAEVAKRYIIWRENLGFILRECIDQDSIWENSSSLSKISMVI